MIQKNLFGIMPDGTEIFNYNIIDGEGRSVVISEFACAIIKINIYDRDKNFLDVALGYDTLDEYINDTRCFGAIVGRYANRIKNACFNLNGVNYKLSRNDGNNTLHGGFNGFNKKIFKSYIPDMKYNKIIFKYTSPHLENGFPGNFVITNTVSFDDGALKMIFDYECDMDTPASITNHCYFNLNGHDSGDILNHKVMINSERYCSADDEFVAVAPPISVQNTPFDFRDFKLISRDIKNIKNLEFIGGYDHCFEVNKNNNNFVAAACSDESGVKLEIYSDMPAVQFYTGNKISVEHDLTLEAGNVKGKGGSAYKNFSGFALECQQFPNAVNEPRFPSAIIKAYERVSRFIEYRFLDF